MNLAVNPDLTFDGIFDGNLNRHRVDGILDGGTHLLL